MQTTVEQSIVLNYQQVKANVGNWIKGCPTYTHADLMVMLKIPYATYYRKLKKNAWTDEEVLQILRIVQS